MPACDGSQAASCVETLADRSIAHVVGATALTVSGDSGGTATLHVAGGAPDRKLTLGLRR